MKHEKFLREFLGTGNTAQVLRDFPPAKTIHPYGLMQLIEEADPRNAPITRSYQDGMIIKDLVYTLMEEWGWTKEEREK